MCGVPVPFILFHGGHVLIQGQRPSLSLDGCIGLDDIQYDGRTIHKGRIWPKFLDICLTVEEKTQEKLNQKIDLTGDKMLTYWMRGNNVSSRPQRWPSFGIK